MALQDEGFVTSRNLGERTRGGAKNPVQRFASSPQGTCQEHEGSWVGFPSSSRQKRAPQRPAASLHHHSWQGL
jgi:hypothetical protein